MKSLPRLIRRVFGSQLAILGVMTIVTGMNPIDGHSEAIAAPMERPSISSIKLTVTDLSPWQSPILTRTLKGHSGTIDALAFTPDSKFLLSGGSYNDGRIRLWNVKTGREVEEARAHRMAVLSIAIAPNGQTFVTGSDDTTLSIWQLKQGSRDRSFLEHFDSILALAITPDSETLITGGPDGIRRWNLALQRPIDTLVDFDAVYSLAISPGGNLLASGNRQGEVKLWDLETAKLIGKFTAHKDAVNAMAFTPNGEILVTGSYDSTIQVWDLSKGELIQTLVNDGDRIRSLALNPDGQTLASASRNGIKLWNLRTGELLTTLSGHSDWVQSVAFSPDGRTLASGGFDRMIKIWQVNSGEPYTSRVEWPEPGRSQQRALQHESIGHLQWHRESDHR